MKNTAWKDGDDEIETYEQEKDNSKLLFVILLVIISTGFVAGEIIMRTYN